MSTIIIKLRTSDDQIYEVNHKVAQMSETIRALITAPGAGSGGKTAAAVVEPISLASVSGPILELVIEWATKHQDDVKVVNDSGGKQVEDDDIDPPLEDIPACDQDFLSKLDHNTLFELIIAADYLTIRELRRVCCKMVAKMMSGKSPDEVRALFNIANDLEDGAVVPSGPNGQPKPPTPQPVVQVGSGSGVKQASSKSTMVASINSTQLSAKQVQGTQSRMMKPN